MNKNKFPRGSEWRKWDLHVHTPDTKLNDQYKSNDGDVWDLFCDSIEKSDVDVIGITDYFSAENYFKFVEAFGKKYQQSTKFFLPNMELRLVSSSNSKGEEHDFHIIFDPEYKEKDATLKELINKFLANLDLFQTDGNGRTVKASSLSSETDFQSATTTITAINKALTETFGEAKPYLKICLLHGHGGTQPITRKSKIAVEIDKFSNLFFGCDDEDRQFGLGNRENQLPPKPVFAGCDAHSFNDLVNRLGKKFLNNPDEKDISKQRFTSPTWIKADKTFEGLRQTLFEPNLRVQIQEVSPGLEWQKTSIEHIEVKDTSNFLIENQKIELNRDLVSVIGGRGSGKSLLLSLFAQLNGNEYKYKEEGEAEKATIEYTLANKSNEIETYTVDINDIVSSTGQPILYLEQKELANDAEDKEQVKLSLLKKIGIEDINTNFNDISATARTTIQSLVTASNKLESIEKNYSESIGTKFSDFKKQIKSDIEKAIEKKEKLSTKESKELIDQISRIIVTGTKYKTWTESGEFEVLKTSLIELNKEIDSLNVKSTELGLQDIQEYPKYDLTSLNRIYEANKKKVDEARVSLRNDLFKKKAELEALGIKEDITALTEALKTIQEEITKLENLLKDYENLEASIKTYKTDLVELFKDESELSIVSRIKDAGDTISDSFKKFLENNSSDYFKKVFCNITVEPKTYFDHKGLFEALEDCFYSGQAPSFKTEIFGNEYPTIEKYFEWIVNGSAIFILDNYRKQQFKSNGREIFIRTIFEDWYKYIKIRPNILGKFGTKEKSIDNMSIGEQATLLLKLKLATDGQINQIIIIDQPEDHLDNEFISTELIELIKVVKKYKQIILATHNANVVVGADSEQVIVARLDSGKGQDLTYLSGSIENPQIKDSIIRILEGGKDALEKRYVRYL